MTNINKAGAEDIFVRLDKQPKRIGSRRVYEWTDFIELLCLINPNRRVSKGDITRRISQNIAKKSNKNPRDYADRITVALSDWFDHINYRLAEFGDNYPFKVSKDNDTLIKKTSMDEGNYLYAFLLMASSLQYIESGMWAEITSSFEYLCCEALEECVPDWAEVRVFGTNKFQERYPNLLIEKVTQLADEISEHVLDDLVPRIIDEGDTGDNGLDLVAWLPFNDNGNGSSVFFGQCACSIDDWPRKQHDVKLEAWDKIIEFTSLPYPFIFIPYCFRKSTGEWNNSRKIRHTVLIDRVRLVQLLINGKKVIRSIPTNFVTSALKYSEGLY